MCFMIKNKLSTTKQLGSMNEAFWARRLREWRRGENRWQIVHCWGFSQPNCYEFWWFNYTTLTLMSLRFWKCPLLFKGDGTNVPSFFNPRQNTAGMSLAGTRARPGFYRQTGHSRSFTGWYRGMTSVTGTLRPG
mgnify:FL=1